MMVTDIFRGERLRMTAPRPEEIPYWNAAYEDGSYLRLVDSGIAWPERNMTPGARTDTHFPFSFRTIAEDRVVGFGAIFRIEWNNQAGMLALGIGDVADRGQGYGREMLFLLLRYAFHELNLHRVGLDVNAYNEDAIRLYEAAGFRREGRMREGIWRDGRRHDRIIMGILRREWERRQA